ncbi:MAG: LamG domain-containing protein, partial [Planctomycetota bacterium]
HKNNYDAGTGFLLGVLDDKSKLGLRVHGGGRRDVSSLGIGAGEWCHVAAVYDGEAVALYRNGGTPRTDPGKGVVLKHDSTPLSIGKGFQGLIDDVRIYDRALSAEEVKALAAMGGTAAVFATEP